ncbi:Transposable element P transposase [Papilio machaon]|uniref:Transposable element P transposase n=1 Tax=Papilio machaon TaxID=76193 RepID=A0A194QQL0_PAPMA|nr:Transposable element P transposase [Papilio machaon]
MLLINLLCFFSGFNKKINLLKQTIIRLRNKCKTQSMKIKMASKVSKSKIFLEMVEQLPEPIKIFTNMQLKYLKKPRGRKYTLKEKILSLTILKQSSKAYNLLKNIFILPSKRTLQKLLSCVVLKPGINPHIMDNLKKAVVKLSTEKRLCSLIFDEVSLAPGLYYNYFHKEIIGFEDYGYKKTNKIADHALVLMIKSLKGRFKQPICFTFCQSATKKEDLKIIIKEVIKAISKTGLKIICTVCDQSAGNMSTIKSLHEDTVQEYVRRDEEFKSNGFEIDGVKIFTFFDPPHLLKGIRNNFLVKNIRFLHNGEVKIAKWEHLIMFMEKDVGDDELRLINKLTESHLIKDKIPRMKVKYAAQVFSQRLSAAIKFCTRNGVLPNECNDTADLLYLIDRLFDSFNGHSYKDEGKKFRTCFKNGSPHLKLWEQVLPSLRSMGFETKKKDGSIKYVKIPSVTNFISNINTFKDMWSFINKHYKITSILTRNLNQDPLENFFCKVRSNGIRNVNPTCDQFINAYKTLLINNFATPHSVNANCEEDNDIILQSMEQFLTGGTACAYDSIENIQINVLMDELETPTEPSQKIIGDLISQETKKYVAGSVLKQARAKVFKNCPVCTDFLIAKQKQETSFIYQRDYTKKSLIYPSTEILEVMKDMFRLISKCIQESPESRLLPDVIKFNIEIGCNFFILNKCKAHATTLKKFIISLTIKIVLYSWCMGVNKILKGKITKFNENDKIKTQACKYYKTHAKYKSK